jgi:hypothetical protein
MPPSTSQGQEGRAFMPSEDEASRSQKGAQDEQKG